MSGHSETIAQAREVYVRMQEEALASTPLTAMPSWLDGVPPPAAAVLRAAGLRGDSERQDIRLARRAFIRHWGFSIPCAEAIEALRMLGPIVEIGAGSAYWTALLRAAGHDAIATDIVAAGTTVSEFSVGRYAEVQTLSAADAVRTYTGRDVFCSWPTEKDPWAYEAVAAMSAGRNLALIGDGRGGCTATETLFDLLDLDFETVAVVEIPQFPRIADRLTIHRRRTMQNR